MKNLLCVARERHLRQRSLVTRIRSAILFPALSMVVAVLGIAGFQIMVPDAVHAPNTYHNGQQRAEEATASTAAKLMKKYGCWGREAPADMRGQIPGGAVMATHGFVHYTEYPPEIGIALDRAIKGEHKDIVDVYGFCRGGTIRTVK